MSKVVGVMYEGSLKKYDYKAPDDLDLELDDIVAVPVRRGWGFAIARVVKLDYPPNYEQGLNFKLSPLRIRLGRLGGA